MAGVTTREPNKWINKEINKITDYRIRQVTCCLNRCPLLTFVNHLFQHCLLQLLDGVRCNPFCNKLSGFAQRCRMTTEKILLQLMLTHSHMTILHRIEIGCNRRVQSLLYRQPPEKKIKTKTHVRKYAIKSNSSPEHS